MLKVKDSLLSSIGEIYLGLSELLHKNTRAR